MSEAIQAYHGITATEEFRSLEWLREKTRRDAAQALGNARRQGAEERDEHWQIVVADKDATIADKDATIANKDARIAELEAQLKNRP